MTSPPSPPVRSALEAIDAERDAEAGAGPDTARPNVLRRMPALFAELNPNDRNELLNGLAERSAGGSSLALELLLALIDEHRLAEAGIRRVLAESAAVDEVAADVLIAVATSIGSFQQRSSFRTWLYSVGSNQAKLFLRGRDRRPSPVEPPDQADVAMRLSSLVSRREDLAVVLAKLPAVYRQAVVLRDIEQLTYQDVADSVGVSVNTVRSRIHRGRAMIVDDLALVE